MNTQTPKTQIVIPKPSIVKGLNSYSYLWDPLDIRVDVSRLNDDGHGEVSFYHLNGNGPELLSVSEMNLLSSSSAATQAKRLEKKYPIDWDTILTYVAALTISDIRKGESIEWVGVKPPSMEIEYQLWPILQKGQPTSIYGPGGAFKSYLAAYIACLVHFGWTGFQGSGRAWTPRKGNVLYLDWEDTKEDLDRRLWAIKKGMDKSDSSFTFPYRRCKTPLNDDLPYIQEMVSNNKIDLVIIDSQMAATGIGPNEAQLATQFYNAIRTLNCTTLTLDHMAKSEIRGDESAGPIGSIVKFNRSRCQFQLQLSQNAGDDFIELSLVNKKNNNAKILLPIGIHIDFVNGEGETLEMVKFSPCNVADNPKLEKTATLKDRLIRILEDGDKTIAQLSEKIPDKKADHIRKELNRYGELFHTTGIKDENRREYWGLIREKLFP